MRTSGVGIISFYRVRDSHGDFSNFALYPINVDGKVWPTTEHYFQAQKFKDKKNQEDIRKTKLPMTAAKMGRSRNRPLRKNWETVKDDIMRKALHAKFTQYPELKELLLSTGNARLVEHTTNDSYWGDGGDGSGKNMLGKLLMELRSQLVG